MPNFFLGGLPHEGLHGLSAIASSDLFSNCRRYVVSLKARLRPPTVATQPFQQAIGFPSLPQHPPPKDTHILRIRRPRLMYVHA